MTSHKVGLTRLGNWKTIAVKFLFQLILLCTITELSESLLELDTDTFDSTISKNHMVMVNFYAPWCGYCQSLSPVLEKVGEEVAVQNLSYIIAQLNAEDAVNADIAEREEIDGFPTIAIYKDGRRIGDYNGHRNEIDIIKYLNMKSGPSALHVSSYDQLEPYLEQLVLQDEEDSHYSGIISVVMALFVTPEAGSDADVMQRHYQLRDSFFKVASECDLALFLITDSEDMIDQFASSSSGSYVDSLIIWYADADLPSTSYVSIPLHHLPDASNSNTDTPPYMPFSDEDILQTILAHSLPAIIQYNADLQPVIQSLPIKQHVLFFCDDSSTSLKDQAFVDAVEKVAQSQFTKGRLLFIEVPSTEHAVVNYFGLATADLPQLLIADMSDSHLGDFRRYLLFDFIQVLQYSDSSSTSDGSGSSRSSSKSRTTKSSSKNKGDDSALLQVKCNADEDAASDPLCVEHMSAQKSLSIRRPGQTVDDLSAPLAFSPDDIHTYLTMFLEKKIPRSVVSELPSEVADRNKELKDKADARTSSLPFTGNGGTVQHITAGNFNVVAEEGVNALVYFYTAWCGHCKSLDPIITHIANIYSRDPHLRVYKIDGAKNEVVHPGVHVRGYPSLYYFPVGGKENPIEYDGERSVNALLRFLNKRRSSLSTYTVEGDGSSRGGHDYLDRNSRYDIYGNKIVEPTGKTIVSEDSGKYTPLGDNDDDDDGRSEF